MFIIPLNATSRSLEIDSDMTAPRDPMPERPGIDATYSSSSHDTAEAGTTAIVTMSCSCPELSPDWPHSVSPYLFRKVSE